MAEKVEIEIKQHIQNIRVEKNEGSSFFISADCLFPENFIGFAGHFPDKPVLPAILQLAAIRFTAEKALSTSLFPLQYNRAKFKKMIEPEQVFSLQLKLVEDNGVFQGKCKISTPKGKLISEVEVSFSTSSPN